MGDHPSTCMRMLMCITPDAARLSKTPHNLLTRLRFGRTAPDPKRFRTVMLRANYIGASNLQNMHCIRFFQPSRRMAQRQLWFASTLTGKSDLEPVNSSRH